MTATDVTTPPPPGAGTHPLVACLEVIAAELDATEAFDPDFLPTDVKADYLRRLLRLQSRITGRLVRAMAGAGDVAEQAGARSAAHWLAAAERVRRGPVVGAQRLGRQLRERYPLVEAALAAGRISADHARAVADSLDELPDDLPGCDGPAERARLVADAERHLVGLCADFDPHEVRRLGRRVLEVVAPEAADLVEQRLLETEERRAWEETSLRLRSRGDGRTRILADVPDLVGDLLRAALAAYTNPRRRSDGDAGSEPPRDPTGERLSRAQLDGLAFCALVEHLPVDGLPTHGGTPVGVTVTLDHERLVAGVGAATLDTGHRLSASAVRRLACDHALIPAVLGGASEVLDLGRRRRLFTAAQRTAHAIAHPTCQAEGCELPAAWCEAHHRTPWGRGGTTDLAELAFLCSFHHHRAHDPAYETTWSEAGRARFHRRE